MGCRLVKASEYKDYEFFKRHGDFYRDFRKKHGMKK